MTLAQIEVDSCSSRVCRKVLVPQLAALADGNDDHFFGHLCANERRALTDAMQALVQHHQLKEIPTA